MKAELTAFATGLGLSVVIAVACGDSERPSCGGPDPEHPEAQVLSSRLEAYNVDPRRGEGPSAVNLEGGVVEVTSDVVAIEYTQDGVQHRLEYAIVGPY